MVRRLLLSISTGQVLEGEHIKMGRHGGNILAQSYSVSVSNPLSFSRNNRIVWLVRDLLREMIWQIRSINLSGRPPKPSTWSMPLATYCHDVSLHRGEPGHNDSQHKPQYNNP